MAKIIQVMEDGSFQRWKPGMKAWFTVTEEGEDFGKRDFIFPSSVASWSEEELKAYNLHKVEDAETPFGKIPQGLEQYKLENGKVVEFHILVDQDLDRVREEAFARVNVMRKNKRYPQRIEINTTSGKHFFADARHDDDLSNLQALYSIGLGRMVVQQIADTDFKDADNQIIKLTPIDLIELGFQITATISEVSVKWSWEIKAQIEAANNADAINAILTAAGV